MLEQFGKKDPIDYFLEKASENVLACYSYFLNFKEKDMEVSSTDPDTSFEEKLLFVLTCLDIHFKAGIVRKTKDYFSGQEAANDKSSSPLPSILCSGTYTAHFQLKGSMGNVRIFFFD